MPGVTPSCHGDRPPGGGAGMSHLNRSVTIGPRGGWCAGGRLLCARSAPLPRPRPTSRGGAEMSYLNRSAIIGPRGARWMRGHLLGAWSVPLPRQTSRGRRNDATLPKVWHHWPSRRAAGGSACCVPGVTPSCHGDRPPGGGAGMSHLNRSVTIGPRGGWCAGGRLLCARSAPLPRPRPTSRGRRRGVALEQVRHHRSSGSAVDGGAPAVCLECPAPATDLPRPSE